MCLGLGPGEFWASRNDFSKFEKMTPTGDLLLGNMWLLLRRMNACIDKFQPNTSQANYFEGFWRITSKTNTKIEVRKQFESCVPIAIPLSLQDMLLKRNEFLPTWPSVSFLPSNPCLFWWIISANSCLLVFNSIIRWKPEKIKRLCNVNTWARRSCWNADHADCRLQTVQTVQYLYLYLNFLVP